MTRFKDNYFSRTTRVGRLSHLEQSFKPFNFNKEFGSVFCDIDNNLTQEDQYSRAETINDIRSIRDSIFETYTYLNNVKTKYMNKEDWCLVDTHNYPDFLRYAEARLSMILEKLSSIPFKYFEGTQQFLMKLVLALKYKAGRKSNIYYVNHVVRFDEDLTKFLDQTLDDYILDLQLTLEYLDKIIGRRLENELN